ncbi:MAG TPA: T9SS type A sorting domain-containing protein [Ignavibacteria bacterium]
MKKIFYYLIFILIVHCTFNIDNCQSQWVQMSNGMENDNNIISLTSIENNIFTGTNSSFSGIGGVFLSTNNGANWIQTALNNYSVYSFATIDNIIFAGTGGYGVYLTTNNGINWTQKGLNGKVISSLAVIGYNIFAGTWDSGIYRSTNNGANWIQTALNNKTVRSLVTLGNNLFAGIDSGGVYLTTNNGISWTQTALNNKYILCLAVCRNDIFASSFNIGVSEVFISTNNGTNWTLKAFPEIANSFAFFGNNIFVGSHQSGVFLSTNYGTNWFQINEGFNFSSDIASLLITNNYIFAGSFHHSIWRRPLLELITSIQNISSEIPSEFSLFQNYPNPFNPTTKIKFEIPLSKVEEPPWRWGRQGVVSLKVFDILGKEVATLVNEQLIPGNYEVTFDGSKFASGVYFYQLRSGEFVAIKKLILLK